uniref:Uncharacterized protein n=1 Tax=Chromera velia CCMP2878 TaxID=1169474 RepID=A0A0G4IF91_9ALVE|eukprot:Cvel_13955.t1-p1 / transcript=Cvel_13955.t1 / gene=Cvel_13955 / organism=Chromera_velia_CCMP2878 / gene_product=hypothetical protein / transcript_product=hypothetical protein / location=Cvel_scaffold974:39000-41776(-) / protein_length=781 / sequence_SO=supercontig / SO=protein_coding / is_pseudo=false
MSFFGRAKREEGGSERNDPASGTAGGIGDFFKRLINGCCTDSKLVTSLIFGDDDKALDKEICERTRRRYGAFPHVRISFLHMDRCSSLSYCMVMCGDFRVHLPLTKLTYLCVPVKSLNEVITIYLTPQKISGETANRGVERGHLHTVPGGSILRIPVPALHSGGGSNLRGGDRRWHFLQFTQQGICNVSAESTPELVHHYDETCRQAAHQQEAPRILLDMKRTDHGITDLRGNAESYHVYVVDPRDAVDCALGRVLNSRSSRHLLSRISLVRVGPGRYSLNGRPVTVLLQKRRDQQVTSQGGGGVGPNGCSFLAPSSTSFMPAGPGGQGGTLNMPSMSFASPQLTSFLNAPTSFYRGFSFLGNSSSFSFTSPSMHTGMGGEGRNSLSSAQVSEEASSFDDVTVVIKDGPLKQPIVNYLTKCKDTQEYDEVSSRSAVARIDPAARLSFGAAEMDPRARSDRQAAMEAAVNQAYQREQHASFVAETRPGPTAPSAGAQAGVPVRTTAPPGSNGPIQIPHLTAAQMAAYYDQQQQHSAAMYAQSQAYPSGSHAYSQQVYAPPTQQQQQQQSSTLSQGFHTSPAVHTQHQQYAQQSNAATGGDAYAHYYYQGGASQQPQMQPAAQPDLSSSLTQQQMYYYYYQQQQQQQAYDQTQAWSDQQSQQAAMYAQAQTGAVQAVHSQSQRGGGTGREAAGAASVGAWAPSHSQQLSHRMQMPAVAEEARRGEVEAAAPFKYGHQRDSSKRERGGGEFVSHKPSATSTADSANGNGYSTINAVGAAVEWAS